MRVVMRVIIIIVLLAATVSMYAQGNSMSGKYLIVLDVQEKYIQNVKDTNDVDLFINSTNELINLADKDKVIYVKQLHRALVIDLKGFHIDTLPEMKLDNRLNLEGDNVFTKTKGDAFSNKELLDFLKEKGAEEIIICGLMAERCVYKTVLGSLENDFKTYILYEAILGKSKKSKLKKIENLKRKGAVVLEI